MQNNVTVSVMDTNSGALERLRKGLKEALKGRLARAREDLDYSPADVLGEFERHGIGRTPGSLSQMEHGSRLPSVEALYVLAKYLNTSADYLLGLTDNNLSVKDIEDDLAHAKGGGNANSVLSRLTKEQRDQVIAYAEFLATQPAPGLTPAQRGRIEIANMLASVERNFDETVRKEVENVLRGKGLLINNGDL